MMFDGSSFLISPFSSPISISSRSTPSHPLRRSLPPPLEASSPPHLVGSYAQLAAWAFKFIHRQVIFSTVDLID